jgi:hypothetical protein
MRRKLLLGAIALILPIGSVISIGAGSANAHANVTGTGTFGCSKITGTITFKPPLTLTAKTVTITSKSMSTGCKGTAKPLPTSTSSVSSSTTANASCTALGNGSKVKFTTTYLPAGIAPSQFTGTNTPSAKTAKPLYFTLKGVVTGSYPSKTASAKAILKETYNQLVAACTGPGLSIIHIIAGTSSNS